MREREAATLASKADRDQLRWSSPSRPRKAIRQAVCKLELRAAAIAARSGDCRKRSLATCFPREGGMNRCSPESLVEEGTGRRRRAQLSFIFMPGRVFHLPDQLLWPARYAPTPRQRFPWTDRHDSDRIQKESRELRSDFDAVIEVSARRLAGNARVLAFVRPDELSQRRCVVEQPKIDHGGSSACARSEVEHEKTHLLHDGRWSQQRSQCHIKLVAGKPSDL